MNEQREKKRKGGNHPENLIPCKKGETRNPNGYSKSLRERDEFRRLCQELWKTGPNDVVVALQEGVKRRKFDCVKEAGDRFFGKVPAKTEVTGANGSPLEISISVIDPETQKKIADIKKKLNMPNE